MKAYAILPLIAAIALSACGKKEEHVYAVDKLAEAQAAAMEKAPKAEPVKFDDEGQPKFGFPADGSAPAAATTDAAAPVSDATATDATATDTAAADKPADAATAEAKPEEAKK